MNSLVYVPSKPEYPTGSPLSSFKPGDIVRVLCQNYINTAHKYLAFKGNGIELISIPEYVQQSGLLTGDVYYHDSCFDSNNNLKPTSSQSKLGTELELGDVIERPNDGNTWVVVMFGSYKRLIGLGKYLSFILPPSTCTDRFRLLDVIDNHTYKVIGSYVSKE